LNSPPITGTLQDFEQGKAIFNLYCAQCHGDTGQGDGPASIKTAGGYISPEPANFTESGSDFPNYGRWVWKVREGVETTNMPPWKWSLNDEEIYQVIFYEQSFSTPQDYNDKWATLYEDSYGRNLMGGPTVSGFIPCTAATLATVIFAGILLWDQKYRKLLKTIEWAKMRKMVSISMLTRRLF
jgi:hypothetical protein